MSNQNNYFTSSLALASAIQSVSTAKLEYIDYTDPSRAVFNFDRSKDPHFDDIVGRFFARQLPIDAATFFDALRFIKSRLYQEKP